MGNDNESRSLENIGSRARRLEKDHCKALVLSPFETDFKHCLISPADRRVIQKDGLAVVHASWSAAEQPSFTWDRFGRGDKKALPLLKSASGVLCALSSIEAIAATLIITGFDEEAREILEVC